MNRNKLANLDTAIEVKSIKNSEINDNEIIGKSKNWIKLIEFTLGVLGTIIAGLILYYIFGIK